MISISVDLQEALVLVFGPIFIVFCAFVLSGSIIAAAISFMLDIAADLEKS